MFKPRVGQFATQIRIQNRHEETVNGASRISYVDAEPALDFCSWKSKGGTENTESGTLVVEDTAEVTMWYRPDISQKDRVLLNDNAKLTYEIIGVPENVENRNMFLIYKVKRVAGA